MLKHHIVFGELSYALVRFALTLLVDDTSERVSLVIKKYSDENLLYGDINQIILEVATKNKILLNEKQLSKVSVYENDTDLEINEPLVEIEKKLMALGIYHNSIVSWLIDSKQNSGNASDSKYGTGTYARLEKYVHNDNALVEHYSPASIRFGNIFGPVGRYQDIIDTPLNNYIHGMIDFSARHNSSKVRTYVSETLYLCFSSFLHYCQFILDDTYVRGENIDVQHQYTIPLKDFIYSVAKALSIDVAFIDNAGEELNAQEKYFAQILDTAGLVTSQGCHARLSEMADSEARRNFLSLVEKSVYEAARWRSDITADALLFAKEKRFEHYFNFGDKIVEISRSINGEKTAICHAAGSMNYGLIENSIMNFVSNMVKLGVVPGTRVAIVANDSPSFAIAVLSLLYSGCVAIIVNPLLKLSTIVQALGSAEVSHVLADKEFISLCRDNSEVPANVIPTISDIYDIASEQPCNLSLEITRWLPARTRPFDEGIGMFTSGTTGIPKLIMHRHQDFVVAAERYAAQVLNINTSDRAFSVSRMSFAFGLHNCFNALFNRATAIISPKDLSIDDIVAAIKLYQPTILYAVPTVYQFLINHPAIQPDDFKAVRCFVSAGDRMPVELNRKWQAKFDASILDSLGSTEAFSTYITNIPGSSRAFGWTGKIVPGFAARIINERGVICGPGDIGTLWLRGPTLPSRYENHGAATASRFRDGWYCTNDMFVRDQQGYFSFFGRSDDVVKVSGQWVAPQDIEDVLLGHPDVVEIAVLAVGDNETTTRTKAFVVTNRQDQVQFTKELKQYARQHLERWKYPHLFQFVEALPRTVTGKLQREKLRHLMTAAAQVEVT
ncbi:AMP-binding protein [Alkalimonas amylolytica]|uniref:Acyl-CoA synthetase (AMP-forming)/AMP-acid ligase II n=1 Tax=Alkalimonas amylolytica TaxID=152573 RepID=A0A1H4AW61_ALKAM|nr:AMP-binding protein [Alkalimonas amylolytica]SEA40131.1 Acyl-CoA synthetase (AMP-forming)/AMP-acid ligase II [Alkalimonas amylolytica]